MNSSSDNSSANPPIHERLTDAVASVGELLERERVEYALIGGLSVAFRGRKRTTEVADFLLNVPAIKLPGLLQAMENAGCQIDQLKAIRQWGSDGSVARRHSD